nr:protein BIC1-like [Coffea arabica]
MKRERPSSSASMTLQNSYDSARDATVSVDVLLLQEFKKANHETASCDEQIKSVKPRCGTNGEFKRHQPRLTSKNTTVKDAKHQPKDDGAAKLQPSAAVLTPLVENLRTTNEAEVSTVVTGRERLKRHRIEVAGRVWIPDIWGQEELLKDWIDCSAFDASVMNSSIMSARAALVEEGRRANSSRIRIENRC